MLYHINPKTGRPNQCKATVKNCPYTKNNVVLEHYNSKSDAKIAYESQMSSEMFKSQNKRQHLHNCSKLKFAPNPLYKNNSIFGFYAPTIASGQIDMSEIDDDYYKNFGFLVSQNNYYDTYCCSSDATAKQLKNELLFKLIEQSKYETQKTLLKYQQNSWEIVENNEYSNSASKKEETKNVISNFKSAIQGYAGYDASYANSVLFDQVAGVKIDDEDLEELEKINKSLSPLTYARAQAPRILYRGIDS